MIAETQESSSNLIGAAQGSLLLNLAWLQRDRCHMEAWIFGYLHRIKFCCIEPPRDSIERVGECASRRTFTGAAKASADARILNPHEVPSGLANHGIEDWSRDILDMHPVCVHRFLKRVETVRQFTSLAQIDGVQSHACTLLEAAGTSTGRKPESLANGALSGSANGDCRGGLAAPSCGVKLASPDSSPENPVASG
jgi:hypothetical protein